MQTNWQNTSERYGTLSIGLHWLMVLLMATVYAFIELREIFPKDTMEREAMKHWHFMLGMLVLFLALARLMFQWFTPKPHIEPPIPGWQTALSRTTHILLYAMMLGLPLAGWLMFSAAGKPVPFFGLELPMLIGENKGLAKQIKEVHETIATLGYALIALHSAAALVHHYFMRDNTLIRMLPRGWVAR